MANNTTYIISYICCIISGSETPEKMRQQQHQQQMPNERKQKAPKCPQIDKTFTLDNELLVVPLAAHPLFPAFGGAPCHLCNQVSSVNCNFLGVTRWLRGIFYHYTTSALSGPLFKLSLVQLSGWCRGLVQWVVVQLLFGPKNKSKAKSQGAQSQKAQAQKVK